MEMPKQTKPFLWGAAAGAIAAMIVGFSWGGWVTNNTAQALVRDGAEAAVVAALTPNCVKDFQQNANVSANLVALKKLSSYEQGSFVEKGGWATRPGATSPDYKLARACSEQLANLK
jgi:alpha/beta superfamily hydrolase